MQLLTQRFDKIIIYYFSGTGNARSVAKWIGDTAEKQKIKVHLVNIGNNERVNEEIITDKTLIGYCYPTHGFNAPPIVLSYLWKFFKSKHKNRFFVLNTRGGMKMSKIFTPGINGLALLLPTLILWIKGYKLLGYRSIDLPSNWISLHPGLKESVVKSIFERCKQITTNFSVKILTGKKVTPAFWWLPIDLALLPISAGYYIYGRFVLSKTFIATNSCNNCGLCIEKCPVKAIKLVNDKPYWLHKCESCMQCMNNCPTRAIETPHGYTSVLWWFNFGILPVLIANMISSISNYKGTKFEIIYNAIFIFLSILIIFGSYNILHKLMNVRYINTIIKYTSLTSYSFWRRYKAPKKFL